jgi:hypothetical protein
MGKDKSILEKITDTMKDIANIAADAADHAVKAEEAPPKVSERSAAHIPLAVDPMMVPPIAAAHAPRKKRASSRRAAKRAGRKTARKAASKSARKTAKKSAARRSSDVVRTVARNTAKKRARKAGKGIRKTS